MSVRLVWKNISLPVWPRFSIRRAEHKAAPEQVIMTGSVVSGEIHWDTVTGSPTFPDLAPTEVEDFAKCLMQVATEARKHNTGRSSG